MTSSCLAFELSIGRVTSAGCHQVVAFKGSGIAWGMKRSASVKLLGRCSGVTSSCLAFELSIGRVTSAGC